MITPPPPLLDVDFTRARMARERARSSSEHARGGTMIVDGRYELLREIGSGSFGTVYEALDRELQRYVAVKILALVDPAREGAGSGRGRIPQPDPLFACQEAKVLAELDHPNVVKIYDHGRGEDYRYLVMQLLDGPTLWGWCQARRRSRAQVVSKFREAGRGLAAVHRAGLIHRDFKPDNVRVGPDGEAMVVDFGLARHLDTLDEDAEKEAHVIGTRPYAAPERLLGGLGDERADQFSFCVAMWEHLGGDNPFGPCEKETLPLQRSLAIIDGPRGSPGGSRRVVRALRRGLSAKPEQRHPSMDALLDALEPRRGRGLDVAIGVLMTVVVGTVLGQLAPSPGSEGGLVAKMLAPWAGQEALMMARRGDLHAAIEALENVVDDELDPLTTGSLARASWDVALEAEQRSDHVDTVLAWWLVLRFARLHGDRELQNIAHDRLYLLQATPPQHRSR